MNRRFEITDDELARLEEPDCGCVHLVDLLSPAECLGTCGVTLAVRIAICVADLQVEHPPKVNAGAVVVLVDHAVVCRPAQRVCA